MSSFIEKLNEINKTKVIEFDIKYNDKYFGVGKVIVCNIRIINISLPPFRNTNLVAKH